MTITRTERTRPGLPLQRVGVRLFAALALVALLSPSPRAVAQQYFDPGFFQVPIAVRPPDTDAPGARLGSFVLFPGVDLGWAYDDNVFFTPDNELSDGVWHIRPYASLRSDWNRHAFNVTADANIARYSDFDQNDYEDWSVTADGRLDVQQNNWFSADVSFFNLREDRRTPDAGGPATPTDFDYWGYGLGYDHIFNRLKVGAYWNYNAFDYEDNVTGDGEFIDNSFRDRDQNRYTVRADYQLGPETAVFGSYAWNTIDYDVVPDANGFFRDSDGSALSAGVVWDMTDLLTGDLFVNWAEQNYDDPRLFDVEGLGFGGGLTWTPRVTTSVNVRLAASPQETVQPGTSGSFSQLWSVRWQEELRRNLLFTLRGSLTDNDYEAPPDEPNALRETQVIRADVGMSYIFNRNLSVSAGYGYETQNSNVGFLEYDANRLYLVFGFQL